jgi:hypothetical protein
MGVMNVILALVVDVKVSLVLELKLLSRTSCGRFLGGSGGALRNWTYDHR